MNYHHLIITITEDHVAALMLNRPEELNALNRTLARELDQALHDLDNNDQVRVILLKGSGRAFCAGIDLHDFFDKSAQGYRNWIEEMERPFVTISRIAKPVIAQVHGVAAANGAGLVAAADLAIASENARIGLTAINVGLNCVGPVIPVSRSVGRKRALEMLFFGNLIKAPKALEMGLINRMVAEQDLEREAHNWANNLAQRSPIAVQNAKRGFYSAADLDYQRAFDFMNETFTRLCCTDDAREGVSAFLEKRAPQWKLR